MGKLSDYILKAAAARAMYAVDPAEGPTIPLRKTLCPCTSLDRLNEILKTRGLQNVDFGSLGMNSVKSAMYKEAARPRPTARPRSGRFRRALVRSMVKHPLRNAAAIGGAGLVAGNAVVDAADNAIDRTKQWINPEGYAKQKEEAQFRAGLELLNNNLDLVNWTMENKKYAQPVVVYSPFVPALSPKPAPAPTMTYEYGGNTYTVPYGGGNQVIAPASTRKLQLQRIPQLQPQPQIQQLQLQQPMMQQPAAAPGYVSRAAYL